MWRQRAPLQALFALNRLHRCPGSLGIAPRPQQRQELRHIWRQRRLIMLLATQLRMNQPQLPGMQRLTGKSLQRSDQRFVCPGWQAPFSAIANISNQRIAAMRQMDANLVSPTRGETRSDQRMGCKAFNDPNMGEGIFTVVDHGLPGSVPRIASNGRFHIKTTGRHPFHNRKILTRHLALSDGLSERESRAAGTRNHH